MSTRRVRLLLAAMLVMFLAATMVGGLLIQALQGYYHFELGLYLKVVFGMRLAHPEPGARLALWRAVVRTALLILLVPALLVDADGRGLHDRLTGTAVVLD